MPGASKAGQGEDARFSSSLLSVFDEPQAEHQSLFRVGGTLVQIEGERISDVAFDRSLEPFRVHVESSHVDLSIMVRWVANLTSSLGRRRLFDSGAVWRLYEGRNGFEFDFSTPAVEERPYKRFLVDSQFRRATLQMSEEYFADSREVADPLEYPLDELLIMHRLTQERAIELHGVGIVGPDGASNLFVGHSGAGKSTTARLWTSLHKVEILSDDRIIVRERPARELRPGDDPKQIFMYGTPWHGEGCFALPQRAPLQRIFVLVHGHGNVLTRLTRSQMVAELFARSFVPFHSHEYVDSALSFLERVADSVPCYRYSFEPDERAVEKVLQWED
jgi:hypothetical protein